MNIDYYEKLSALIACKSISPLVWPVPVEIGNMLLSFSLQVFDEQVYCKGNPHSNVWIYVHFDTKPPDPIDEWLTDPFILTKVSDKLHGLGVSDSKFQFLNVLEVCNDLDIFIIVDLAEESGNSNAGRVITRFCPDFLVIVDGSSDISKVFNGTSGQIDASIVLSTGEARRHPAAARGCGIKPVLQEFLLDLSNPKLSGNLTGICSPRSIRSLTVEELDLRVDIRYGQAVEVAVNHFLERWPLSIRQHMPPVVGKQPYLKLANAVIEPARFSIPLSGASNCCEHVLVVPGGIPENGNHRPNEFIYTRQVAQHQEQLRQLMHFIMDI